MLVVFHALLLDFGVAHIFNTRVSSNYSKLTLVTSFSTRHCHQRGAIGDVDPQCVNSSLYHRSVDSTASRYLFTIGHQGVFRLRRWSSRIHTELHGLRATWDPAREPHEFRIRGYHPLCQRFPTPSATHKVSHSPPGRQSWQNGPATPTTQRLPAITRHRFGLIRFRSPLLAESRLLSLPAGTEMFHFPALPPPALCVQAGVTANYGGSGFPIRKPPDHSLVTGSPGLIAGSSVLHRLLVPRHPPCRHRSPCGSRLRPSILPCSILSATFGSALRLLFRLPSLPPCGVLSSSIPTVVYDQRL